MVTGLSDNDIISKVLSGDRQAFAALVNRYQDYVFTLALRMIRSREDAEEVAQDVFVKAYKALSGFRGDSKFSTWLYTIVNTTCLSFLRKKRPWVQSLDNEKMLAAAEVRDPGMDAIPVEQKSKQMMVQQAINLLNPDDAEVITLFYKAEQSLEEISFILGIEVNAAKVRLHRARVRLKEKMQWKFSEELKDL